MTISYNFLILATIGLVILKLTSVISWAWWVVLMPIWLPIAVTLSFVAIVLLFVAIVLLFVLAIFLIALIGTALEALSLK